MEEDGDKESSNSNQEPEPTPKKIALKVPSIFFKSSVNFIKNKDANKEEEPKSGTEAVTGEGENVKKPSRPMPASARRKLEEKESEVKINNGEEETVREEEAEVNSPEPSPPPTVDNDNDESSSDGIGKEDVPRTAEPPEVKKKPMPASVRKRLEESVTEDSNSNGEPVSSTTKTDVRKPMPAWARKRLEESTSDNKDTELEPEQSTSTTTKTEVRKPMPAFARKRLEESANDNKDTELEPEQSTSTTTKTEVRKPMPASARKKLEEGNSSTTEDSAEINTGKTDEVEEASSSSQTEETNKVNYSLSLGLGGIKLPTFKKPKPELQDNENKSDQTSTDDSRENSNGGGGLTRRTGRNSNIGDLIALEDPMYECETCGKQFHNLYSKKKHVQTIHLGIRDREENYKSKSKEIFDKVRTCPICSVKRSFPNKKTYRDHVRKCKKPKKSCALCSKQFSSETDLIRHIKEHASSNQDTLTPQEAPIDPQSIFDTNDIIVPSSPFSTRSDEVGSSVSTNSKESSTKSRSSSSHEAVKRKMAQALTIFSSKRLKEDQSEKSVKSRPMPASIKKKLEERLSSSTSTNVNPFTCRFCGQTFSNTGNRGRHERNIHSHPSNQSTLSTSVDPMKSSQSSSETESRSEEVDSKKCSICNKTFSHKWKKERHLREVHKLKSKSVITKSTLGKKSLVTKSKAKDPRNCKFCGKWFSRIGKTKRHERIYHVMMKGQIGGPLPTSVPAAKDKRECRFCGKKFSSGYNRKCHEILTHADKMDANAGAGESGKLSILECEVCQKVFTLTDSRRRHERDFHGIANPRAGSKKVTQNHEAATETNSYEADKNDVVKEEDQVNDGDGSGDDVKPENDETPEIAAARKILLSGARVSGGRCPICSKFLQSRIGRHLVEVHNLKAPGYTSRYSKNKTESNEDPKITQAKEIIMKINWKVGGRCPICNLTCNTQLMRHFRYSHEFLTSFIKSKVRGSNASQPVATTDTVAHHAPSYKIYKSAADKLKKKLATSSSSSHRPTGKSSHSTGSQDSSGYNCPCCEKTFTFKGDEYDEHKAMRQPKKKSYIACRLCWNLFSHHEDFLLHMKFRHKDGDVPKARTSSSSAKGLSSSGKTLTRVSDASPQPPPLTKEPLRTRPRSFRRDSSTLGPPPLELQVSRPDRVRGRKCRVVIPKGEREMADEKLRCKTTKTEAESPPENQEQDVDPKVCTVCHKKFSSIWSKERHERDVHKLKKPPAAAAATQRPVSRPSSSSRSTRAKEPTPEPEPEPMENTFHDDDDNHFDDNEPANTNYEDMDTGNDSLDVSQMEEEEPPPSHSIGLCEMPCSTCNEIFYSFEALRKHELYLHNVKTSNMCPICATYPSKLNRHLIAHENNTVRPKCVICNLKFKDFPGLKQHNLENHPRPKGGATLSCNKPRAEIEEDQRKKEKGSATVFKCQLCRKEYDMRMKARKHIRQAHCEREDDPDNYIVAMEVQVKKDQNGEEGGLDSILQETTEKLKGSDWDSDAESDHRQPTNEALKPQANTARPMPASVRLKLEAEQKQRDEVKKPAAKRPMPASVRAKLEQQKILEDAPKTPSDVSCSDTDAVPVPKVTGEAAITKPTVKRPMPASVRAKLEQQKMTTSGIEGTKSVDDTPKPKPSNRPMPASVRAKLNMEDDTSKTSTDLNQSEVKDADDPPRTPNPKPSRPMPASVRAKMAMSQSEVKPSRPMPASAKAKLKNKAELKEMTLTSSEQDVVSVSDDDNIANGKDSDDDYVPSAPPTPPSSPEISRNDQDKVPEEGGEGGKEDASGKDGDVVVLSDDDEVQVSVKSPEIPVQPEVEGTPDEMAEHERAVRIAMGELTPNEAGVNIKVTYQCKLCSKAFDTIENMRRHIHRGHSEYGPEHTQNLIEQIFEETRTETTEDSSRKRKRTTRYTEEEYLDAHDELEEDDEEAEVIIRRGTSTRRRTEDPDPDFEVNTTQPQSKSNNRPSEKHPPAELRFACEFCGKRMDSYGNARRHVSQAHRAEFQKGTSKGVIELLPGVEPPRPGNNAKSYRCRVCHWKLEKYHGIYQHVRRSHPEAFTEEATARDLIEPIYEDSLDYHNHNNHDGQSQVYDQGHSSIPAPEEEITYSCTLCNFFTSVESEYVKHYKRHTGVSPYQCQYCAGTFSKNQQLLAHMEREHQGAEFLNEDDEEFRMEDVTSSNIEVSTTVPIQIEQPKIKREKTSPSRGRSEQEHDSEENDDNASASSEDEVVPKPKKRKISRKKTPSPSPPASPGSPPSPPPTDSPEQPEVNETEERQENEESATATDDTAQQGGEKNFRYPGDFSSLFFTLGGEKAPGGLEEMDDIDGGMSLD